MLTLPHAENGDATDFSSVRLVHVVRQYAPNIGGLEDVVRNLAARQNGRFAGLKVVTLDRLFRDPGRTLPSHEMIDGVEVCRIPFAGSSRYPIAPAVFREIADADLVHVHAVDFFFDALALSRFWHRKVLVATTHGGFFHTRKHAAIKTLWFNTLTRFSANLYSALACCSESDLEQFEKIAPRRVRLVENGVDIEKFRDASSPRPSKRLLTLGRFSNNKRLDRAIDVLAHLRKSDPDWHLDIAGINSDLTEADLLAQARALGVDDGVAVHTGLPDEGIRALMGAASIFVSASEYEGFGLAVIEAMSAGLVPVVQPNTAFKALNARHPCIQLADFGEPGTVADRIAGLIAGTGSLTVLRNEAMGAALQHGWSKVASLYDEVYRTALQGTVRHGARPHDTGRA